MPGMLFSAEIRQKYIIILVPVQRNDLIVHDYQEVLIDQLFQQSRTV